MRASLDHRSEGGVPNDSDARKKKIQKKKFGDIRNHWEPPLIRKHADISGNIGIRMGGKRCCSATESGTRGGDGGCSSPNGSGGGGEQGHASVEVVLCAVPGARVGARPPLLCSTDPRRSGTGGGGVGGGGGGRNGVMLKWQHCADPLRRGAAAWPPEEAMAVARPAKRGRGRAPRWPLGWARQSGGARVTRCCRPCGRRRWSGPRPRSSPSARGTRASGPAACGAPPSIHEFLLSRGPPSPATTGRPLGGTNRGSAGHPIFFWIFLGGGGGRTETAANRRRLARHERRLTGQPIAVGGQPTAVGGSLTNLTSGCWRLTVR